MKTTDLIWLCALKAGLFLGIVVLATWLTAH